MPQARTHKHKLYVSNNRKKGRRHYVGWGTITSSLRRMVVACLAEIFSSANTIRPLTLSPASLEIHITPIPPTQFQFIPLPFMEDSTQHGFPILVCLFASFINDANEMDNKGQQHNTKATKENKRRLCLI